MSIFLNRSNEMVEPPYWGNAHEDNLPFHWFEKICVQNLTPLTIRRIKEWLFGGNNELPRAISDFKFARLLFAFFGTPNFRALQGSIGHSWRPRFSNFKEHKFEMPGDDDEDEDNHEYNTEVTWLEYQVRLVTSSLRDIDYYYEPFDEIFHKELWGEALIDARESRNREEMSHFRGINHEDLCQSPWIVWDIEMEKKSSLASSEDLWDSFGKFWQNKSSSAHSSTGL